MIFDLKYFLLILRLSFNLFFVKECMLMDKKVRIGKRWTECVKENSREKRMSVDVMNTKKWKQASGNLRRHQI